MKLGSVAPALLSSQFPSYDAISIKLGDMLRTMFPNDIQAIADKMSHVVFKRLTADDPTFQAKNLPDENAESVFLSSTPFKDSLAYCFQYGRNALFFENEPYLFSYAYIFNHLKTSIPNLMKPQLTQWPQYTIHLSLDMKESERQGTLVFILAEANGIDVLSEVSFTCEDLAIENSEPFSSMTEIKKDRTRILREIDVCRQTQKILRTQLLQSEQQLANLQKELTTTTEKLEN